MKRRLGMLLVAALPALGAGAAGPSACEQESAELAAAFDLMVRKLAEKDRELAELRRQLAERRGEDEDGAVEPMLGCPVDEARRLIVAESFIYDREQVLLRWLEENRDRCKLLELKALANIAERSSLNQSRAMIYREMARRGEPIPEGALLGMPLPPEMSQRDSER